MIKSFSSADLRGNPLGGLERALEEVDVVTIYKRATTVTIDPTTVTVTIDSRQTYVP
jgi:hypothetical protein